MNEVEIYLHDLTPVAQRRVLNAAGLKDASEGNFESSALAILNYENNVYIPQIGHIVNVSDPPDPNATWSDTNSAWSHAFIGTVLAVNEEEGYATVTDMDDERYDIDFIYLSKDESEE